MNIQLTNFKCHESLELSFPDKATVLICGASGHGKSTILQAIAWSLYGVIKKVAPFKSTTIKTTVVLTLDNMVITRTKNPKHLTFIHNAQTYENQEAQKKIDQFFGIYDIWLSTSYVMQKKENFFLDTSNAKKMEVLNSIVFQYELPSTFINIIDKSLDKNKHLQDIKLELLNKKLALFNEDELRLTNNVIDQEQTTNDLNKLKQQLQLLLDVKKQRDIQIAIKNTKESELHQLQMGLNTSGLKYYFDYNDDKLLLLLDKDTHTKEDIDYVEDVINTLTINNEKLKDKNRLEEKLAGLTATTDHYEPEFLEQVIKDEKLFNANELLLTAYELPPEQNEINECIDYFYEILNSQDYLVLDEKLTLLSKNYEALQNVNMDDFVAKNEAMKIKLNNYHEQIKNASNALECPHCNCHVLLQQNQLVKVDSMNKNALDNMKKEINTLTKEINNNNVFIQQYQQDAALKMELGKQIDTIKESLENMSKPVYYQVLTLEEKEQTFDSIRKLKSVTLIDKPPIPSSTIKNAIEYHAYLEQLNKIELPDHYHMYDVKKLNDIYRKLKENMYKHQNITEQIQKIVKKMDSIVIVNDPEEQIINIKNDIVHLETSLINHKKALKVIKEYDALNEFRGEVMTISQKLEDLTTLKQYAIDIECKILQNIIDNINASLYDICNMLFQDCIVELSLYKTVKGKQETNTKPFVHFTVYQNSIIHEHTGELSGGELDRLSLAITLALHKLSPCGFIMLDELSSSLNDEQKNLVINCIKEHTNCITIYTQHGGIQGVFDKVIDI